MSRELRLRNLILDKYPSLRQFSAEADIPYSTLMTLLSRDIGGASFDTVIKICKTLDVDPEEFYSDYRATNRGFDKSKISIDTN